MKYPAHDDGGAGKLNLPSPQLTKSAHLGQYGYFLAYFNTFWLLTYLWDKPVDGGHNGSCIGGRLIHRWAYALYLEFKMENKNLNKVGKMLKGSLDSILSPSPSVKIQIMGGKVCLRCKGKTLLDIVNKKFVDITH